MPEPMNELPDELREVESRLAGLRPAAPRIDRDALLYGAGRASGLRRQKGVVRLWQSAFATAMVLFAGFALLQRPARPVEGGARGGGPEVEQAERAAPGRTDIFAALDAGAQRATNDGEYLLQRQRFLKNGTLDSEARPGAPATSQFLPTLKRAEGLDAVPVWQRRAILPHVGGNQS